MPQKKALKNEAAPHFINVNESFDFYSVLALAAARGHVNIVDLLLKSGVDVNAVNTHGWNALMFAAYFGKADIVRILFAAGVAPNSQTKRTGKTALNLAAERNHYEVARWMAGEATTDVNRSDSDGWTPLMNICKYSKDNVETATALLNHGAHIHATSIYGWTAMLRAAEANNPGILDVLIRHGAHVDHTNAWHSTALMLASYDASSLPWEDSEKTA